MKSISLKTKIMTGLITGGLLLSSVSAFATTTTPLNTDGKATLKNECRQPDLETNLKKIVADKTVTQDQANKIKGVIIKAEAAKKADFKKIKTMTQQQRKTYMDSNKIKHINPLKVLVDNKTITQSQADKVGLGGPGNFKGSKNLKNKFRQHKGELQATLKLGVSSKIITQTESNKILAYQNSKIKTNDKTQKPDFFKELVNNKILSQTKADALKSSEKTQRDTKRQQALETNLKKLVADKTVTQDQANKIKDVIIKAEAAKKADFKKTKTMTETQRKTYMDNSKTKHINPLKSLVDNGTITQAQVDKVGSGAHNHMPGLNIK